MRKYLKLGIEDLVAKVETDAEGVLHELIAGNRSAKMATRLREILIAKGVKPVEPPSAKAAPKARKNPNMRADEFDGVVRIAIRAVEKSAEEKFGGKIEHPLVDGEPAVGFVKVRNQARQSCYRAAKAGERENFAAAYKAGVEGALDKKWTVRFAV
jgi:hypothetical protein